MNQSIIFFYSLDSGKFSYIMSKQVLTVAYSMSKFSQRDPWLVYLNNIFIYLFGCVQSQLQHRGSSSLTGKETQVPLHWEYGVSATGLPGKSPG